MAQAGRCSTGNATSIWAVVVQIVCDANIARDRQITMMVLLK
ncbi:MAG: hypothetical protein Q8K23_05090 [Sulfuritalea sp.]|nr:hypothetical protein [Sulfuritalea sp.]